MSNYGDIIDNAVFWASKPDFRKVSRLSDGVFGVYGMTSARIRVLYNELCRMMGKDCVYLEVGTWRGSSLLSASYKNSGQFFGIDNFRQFFRPTRTRRTLFRNIREHWGDCHVMFIEGDIYEIDLGSLPNPNVFLYDAGHTADEHKNGIERYKRKLQDESIIIVDDWDREYIRSTTRETLESCGLEIIHEREVFSNNRDDPENWWNGVFLAYVAKK